MNLSPRYDAPTGQYSDWKMSGLVWLGLGLNPFGKGRVVLTAGLDYVDFAVTFCARLSIYPYGMHV
jgi:hypothetical protein